MAPVAADLATPSPLAAALANGGAEPDYVTFPSDDGRTMLDAYVFQPPLPQAARAPAVVMMHGSAGIYASSANGTFDASTLAKRHTAWGRLLAGRGYLAILVDGFKPRGYPTGFRGRSYGSRPAEVDEVTARPRDAFDALRYLRSRPDVVPDRVGLVGWSNGGSATLVAMANDAPGAAGTTPETGFRAGVAFYPGCWLKRRYANGYHCYAPVRVFLGADDQVIACRHCTRLVGQSRSLGHDIELTMYEGAGHGFDDPSPRRQVAANAAANADAVSRVVAFLARHLAPP